MCSSLTHCRHSPILALETPTRLERRIDLDERCFALLPRISLDPAQLGIEQLVQPPVLFWKSISFADNLTSLGSSVGFFGKVSAPRQIPLFERVGKHTSSGRETLRGMPVLLRDLSEQHLRSWSCPPR